MKQGLNTEDQFVRSLTRDLPLGNHVVIGAGDDCAVVRIPGCRKLLLLKTDCVVEGVHFEQGFPGTRVGQKALNRVISDLAAMGGSPSEALVTLFSPTDTPLSYWRSVYAGLRKSARQHKVSIVGGETSRADVLAVTIAATGFVTPSLLTRRSSARPGDLLFVTGTLGGSLTRKHWAFQPRLPEAQWLARHGFARAMMDLSDGLAADLPRLASASKCGFSVDPTQIPTSKGCKVQAALCDGEDYELLFACPPRKSSALKQKWPNAFPNLRLSEIGCVTRPKMGRGFGLDLQGGYDHFSPRPASYQHSQKSQPARRPGAR